MNAETENEVVRRWRQGASQRRIARELKISRDSVQRILGRHERQRDAGGLDRRRHVRRGAASWTIMWHGSKHSWLAGRGLPRYEPLKSCAKKAMAAATWSSSSGCWASKRTCATSGPSSGAFATPAFTS